MITKLLGVATLFTAGSILVGSAPTLGAQDLSGSAGPAAQAARCGHRCARVPRCARIPRCAHVPRCGHRCGHLLEGAPSPAGDQG